MKIKNSENARADRVDKHSLVAHVERELYQEFKILSAMQLKTTDALMYEALALLFAKHGRPMPAKVSAKLKQLGITE